MNERRIICAKTLHYKSTVKADQYALRDRADNIARQLSAWVADKPHEVIVMEGFLGYSGKGGGYVFQTPYPGCEHCTNDHLRAAACHGAYYLAHHLRPAHA